MDDKKKFSIADRLKSFVFAINGLKYFFKTGHNVWIHITFAIAVLMAGKIYNIAKTEWCLVFISISLVLASEAFNTAIELLTDMVSPGYNDQAKRVKDIAAGAVLISAIMALTIGLFIFLPKIVTMPAGIL